MRRHSPAVATLLAAVFASAAPVAAQQPIRGFPASMVEAQRQLESRARALPNADTLRNQMRILSEDPHHAGSANSRKVAELILARFRSYGLDAEIERFEALMPVPVTRSVELIAPEHYTAKLKEPAIPEDKDSGDAGQLPTYNAYSPDGDVTGELVFVNYGTPEDYEVLDSLGIDVRGRIVIAKYGRSWRGIKPKVAAEHGAIATLIYSDPEDDGYFVDDIYPKGPMRPWQGVQRGSVMDMPTYPGDLLSPGWASEEGARKLPMDSVTTFSPIPVLPLSYGDALPLLRNLGGPVAPRDWRGGLPITYHMGAGPAKVHMVLKFDWQTRPLYDVIARVPGRRWPDQWVVFGNHHDGWVNGANDPIAGQVAMDEAARSIGALLKTGWRPERTIIFAAWDGEEWGLLGSTEWAEKHAEELSENAVVYINSDTNSRGWLSASGSHSLQQFVRELARDIPDPKSGETVLAALMERRAERARSNDEDEDESPDTAFTIGALGSGSDYTAFLDHLGLPSLNLSYGGGAHAGVYHSIYDSFDHYTRFEDTTFQYGVAQAQTLATAALRLADAPILPFQFSDVADTYARYVDDILKTAKKKDETKSLDLTAVKSAVAVIGRAADRFDAAMTAAMTMDEADVKDNVKQLAEINATLYGTERLLADPAGLEHREWFRHLIYAPGFYTGYGVKTMPGIREAVEDVPNGQVAQREAARVAKALEAYAAQVDAAAAALERLGN